jgi:predicted phage tail protein
LNTSKTLSNLSAGTYYWQVRAKNARATKNANNGIWWSFTVPPKPGAFSKISPPNNKTGLGTSLTLKWATSTNAAKYQYCYDTINNNKCDGSWLSTGLKTSKYITGLVKGKTYYWMVRAVNAVGKTYSNSNTWWKFTTKP